MIKRDVIAKLKTVGLVEVIMGIQSGSPYIRSEIFHRYETQEDIINATKILAEEGIFGLLMTLCYAIVLKPLKL